MRCDRCELMRINGVLCHETGCPSAWKTEIRECAWCGNDFSPQEGRQLVCDEECYRMYSGIGDSDMIHHEENE